MSGLEGHFEKMTLAFVGALERERSPAKNDERLRDLEIKVDELRLEQASPKSEQWLFGGAPVPVIQPKKPTIPELVVQGAAIGVGGFLAYKGMEWIWEQFTGPREYAPPVENHFYETTATIDGEHVPAIVEGLTGHMDANLDKYQGPEGTPGEPGQDGATGPRGFRGFAGQDGRNGRAGRRGSRGSRGTDGSHGRNGSNGRDGRDGRVMMSRRPSKIRGDWLL